MARTKGSNSIASIHWKSLVRRMEGEAIASQCRYEGFIDVSRIWVKNYFTPTSELVLVDRSEVQSPFAEVSPDTPVIEMTARPTTTVLSKCVPKEFNFTDEDIDNA